MRCGVYGDSGVIELVYSRIGRLSLRGSVISRRTGLPKPSPTRPDTKGIKEHGSIGPILPAIFVESSPFSPVSTSAVKYRRTSRDGNDCQERRGSSERHPSTVRTSHHLACRPLLTYRPFVSLDHGSRARQRLPCFNPDRPLRVFLQSPTMLKA